MVNYIIVFHQIININCILLAPQPPAKKVAPAPPMRVRAASAASFTQKESSDVNPDAFDLTSRLDNSLDQRERIVKEIYTTENDYVAKLTQLVEQCYNPVIQGKYKNVFSDNERKMIYGNIEIVRNMNIRFQENLKPRIQSWHQQQTIGDVFLQIVSYFLLKTLR